MKVKINVAVEWHNEPAQGNGFNTIAEIPGSDLVDEVVIAGAHLDSTQGSAGATDNAAGSAAVMEIARIITRLGLKPRRTIRLALWGGEEEGLLGSQAYVKQHYGDWMNGLFTPETRKVSAYFNVDNGSGRTRGIWMHGDLSAEPVLREWLTALRDLGVTTLGRRNTITSLSGGAFGAGSDWAPFFGVGIPSFGLMQDRLEYMSRTHHTNMDYVDHASRDDLIQTAVVLAVLVYEASTSPGLMPRTSIPPMIGR